MSLGCNEVEVGPFREETKAPHVVNKEKLCRIILNQFKLYKFFTLGKIFMKDNFKLYLILDLYLPFFGDRDIFYF